MRSCDLLILIVDVSCWLGHTGTADGLEMQTDARHQFCPMLEVRADVTLVELMFQAIKKTPIDRVA